MIKRIHVNELLFSNLLVYNAVSKVNNVINDNTAKNKIILASGRGSGKSVILKRKENDTFRTEHPAIYTCFDSAGMFGTKDNEYFNKEIMEHYYEVIMSKKILGYIKEWYPEYFYPKFVELDDLTNKRVAEVDNYINYAYYSSSTIDHKLLSGEALSKIISLFKDETKTMTETLTLMIDRFDWTHNSDPRVQEILSKYFDMFDKVIITSDDPTIKEEGRRENLEKNGFEIIDSSYSTDLNTVKDIIFRRIAFDGEQKYKLPIDKVSDGCLEKIINRCDGNINTMLDTFLYAEILYCWNGKDVGELLDQACTQKTNDVKEYRKMVKSPSLHL